MYVFSTSSVIMSLALFCLLERSSNAESPSSACNPNPCAHGSTCNIPTDPGKSATCTCSHGYTGALCDDRIEYSGDMSGGGSSEWHPRPSHHYSEEDNNEGEWRRWEDNWSESDSDSDNSEEDVWEYDEYGVRRPWINYNPTYRPDYLDNLLFAYEEDNIFGRRRVPNHTLSSLGLFLLQVYEAVEDYAEFFELLEAEIEYEQRDAAIFWYFEQLLKNWEKKEWRYWQY